MFSCKSKKRQIVLNINDRKELTLMIPGDWMKTSGGKSRIKTEVKK